MAHPALIKVVKSGGSGPPTLIILDKNAPLFSLTSIISLRLQDKETKKADLLFFAVDGTKGTMLNASLSLNDFGFDEESQFLKIMTIPTFEKTAMLLDLKSISQDAVHSGPVQFYPKAKKKPVSCEAVLVKSALYLFRQNETTPFRVFPLDYFLFSSEKFEDTEEAFRLERIGLEIFSPKPVWIVASGAQSLMDWSSLLRAQCRNTILNVVFGTPLEILIKRTPHLSVPPILTDCIEFFRINPGLLDEEGIFRKSCNGQMLQKIISKVDNGEFNQGVQFLSEIDPHVITGLVKRWLGQLPIPLLSPAPSFLSLPMDEDEAFSKKRIMELVAQLPPVSCAVLSTLCSFLFEVAEHRDKNLMSIENLALVIGPNLMFTRGVSAKELQEKASLNKKIVTFLIEHHEELVIYAEEARGKLMENERKIEEQQKDPLSYLSNVINKHEQRDKPPSVEETISFHPSASDVKEPVDDVSDPTIHLSGIMTNPNPNKRPQGEGQKRRRSMSVGTTVLVNSTIVQPPQTRPVVIRESSIFDNSLGNSASPRKESGGRPATPNSSSRSGSPTKETRIGKSSRNLMASEGLLREKLPLEPKSLRKDSSEQPKSSPKGDTPRDFPPKPINRGVERKDSQSQGQLSRRKQETDQDLATIIKSLQTQLQRESTLRILLEERLEQEILERKLFEKEILEKLSQLQNR